MAEALRKLFIDAELASHTFTADDGYLSTAVHTNEEAADRAVAALAAAGPTGVQAGHRGRRSVGGLVIMADPDLHTKLRSAIEERLALAQAASGAGHGNTPTGEHWHWECSADDTPIPITDVVLMDEFLECPRCGSVGVGLRSVEEYQTDSVGMLCHLVTNSAEEISPIVGAHIAANDPAFVIRACRADLDRLEAHRPCHCDIATRDGYQHCVTHGCPGPRDRWWPCPEVRSLAEVWLPENET